MRALILEDGLSRQALAGARALRAAGWTVGVAAPRRGITGTSRAVSFDHRVPAPDEDLEAWVAGVNAAIAEHDYEVVFPARDVELRAVSERRDSIEAIVPCPPHGVVLRAMDKGFLTPDGKAAGFAAPRTWLADAESLRSVPLPVMVKARLHAGLDGEAPPRLATGLATTREEAETSAGTIRDAGGEPLLQEHVAGRLVALSFVADGDGRLVAAVQQEADEVWPRRAGVSVRARTVTVDDGMVERAEALTTRLGWTGIAELQLIASADGDPMLIDFNGRFYGSMALAVGAGVNLPAIAAALATGREMEHRLCGRPGVRYQWLFGDLRRVLDEGGAHRPRRLLGSARYARGAVQSVFSPRDPRPAIRHASLVGRRVLRRAPRWS